MQQQQQQQQPQQGAAGAPNPSQGQQQAQAAVAAAASAQQMAAAASAQQAAALAAMLPAAAAGGARPALALHPALAAIQGNQGLTMLPMAGPAGTFTFAARPGMPQPFFYPAVPQPVAPLAPSPSAAAAAAAAAARRPSSRPGSRSSSAAAAGKKHCNCKNSRCLKLYCECFASGRYCDGCNCLNCYNNREHEATRQSAVEAILERNPNAFRPKIAPGADNRRAGGARHNKGCNCKKSGCLKKYCECFQAGIVCSEICKCLDCKNYEGSEARDALVSPQGERQGSPVGLRRTSRTISPSGPGARPGFASPGAAAPAAAAGSGSLPSLAQLQQAQAAAAAQAVAAQAAAGQPASLAAEQKQQVAREVVREVVKPELVEKLAMLLMLVSQEEHERRQLPTPSPSHSAAAAATQREAEGGAQAASPGSSPAGAAGGGAGEDEAAAMDVDMAQQAAAEAAGGAAGKEEPAEQAPAADAALVKLESMDVDTGAEAAVVGPATAEQRDAAAPAANGGAGEEEAEEMGLYAAQERLVLTEFRDTMQMISRLVGEKVEKKVQQAQQAQQALLPTSQQGTPSVVGMAPLPQLRPAAQASQPGSAGMFMPGQPQLVLLPPALMAQQLAAAGQTANALGMAMTLQQTPQGFQAVYKSMDPQQAGAAAAPAAAGAPAGTPVLQPLQLPPLPQPQPQQAQQQEAAATPAVDDGGTQ